MALRSVIEAFNSIEDPIDQGDVYPDYPGIVDPAPEERYPRINTAFYHGGEPIRVIRPFLEGEVRKPYLLSMTAAGQSALVNTALSISMTALSSVAATFGSR